MRSFYLILALSTLFASSIASAYVTSAVVCESSGDEYVTLSRRLTQRLSLRTTTSQASGLPVTLRDPDTGIEKQDVVLAPFHVSAPVIYYTPVTHVLCVTVESINNSI